ncbi:enoyl-CoA hydratase/isomerase family protein, partial [Alcaligenaceae bacterium Me47]
DGLRAQLVQLRDDDAVRAVIITGAEGVFCAGADITAFDSLRAEPLLGDRAAAGGHFWAELERFPKPVIAAVEKLALGGGTELALACDIAIAGESTKFGVPEVKLGAIPGAGGTQRLIHAIGKSKAMALLLTGDFIDARKACDAGMVAEVTADGQALPTALAMANRIASNSPLAVALAK